MNFDITSIKLIVGLGNFQKEYDRTRHNVGFMFVEDLADHYQGSWQSKPKQHSLTAQISLESVANSHKIILVKPQTGMNVSGRAVQSLMSFYKFSPKELLLVYDDLDIDFGRSKLQFASNPKKHNGVNSVIRQINSNQFWNLRIGIENRKVQGNQGVPGMRFALERFTLREQHELDSVFLECRQKLEI